MHWLYFWISNYELQHHAILFSAIFVICKVQNLELLYSIEAGLCVILKPLATSALKTVKMKVGTITMTIHVNIRFTWISGLCDLEYKLLLISIFLQYHSIWTRIEQSPAFALHEHTYCVWTIYSVQAAIFNVGRYDCSSVWQNSWRPSSDCS